MIHWMLAAITFSMLWVWAVAHQLIIGWIGAVMIDQMPAPQKAYGFYAWFFGVTQVLAANLKRSKLGVQGALQTKTPEPKP